MLQHCLQQANQLKQLLDAEIASAAPAISKQEYNDYQQKITDYLDQIAIIANIHKITDEQLGLQPKQTPSITLH